MTLIGYDITDGLDGEVLFHDFSRSGGITVIGPEEVRSVFRERFLSRVVGLQVIRFDFDEVSNAQLEQFVRDQTYSKEPRLLVVSNPPKLRATGPEEGVSPKWRRVESLSHMENMGLAVFFEFDSFMDDRPRNTVYWSSTVVLLAPSARTDAYVITSDPSIPDSFAETYVVCGPGEPSSSYNRRGLPVVLA